MLKQFLECGKIVSTHGIKGELKLLHWCNSAEYLLDFKNLYLDNGGKQRLDIEASRIHKGMLLLKVRGIDSIDDAVPLRGKILYLNREDDTSPGLFIQDILGMDVQNADTKKEYGKITDVFSTGVHNVYTITDTAGKERLIPVIPEVIVNMDTDARLLLIRPLKGLFDDED